MGVLHSVFDVPLRYLSSVPTLLHDIAEDFRLPGAKFIAHRFERFGTWNLQLQAGVALNNELEQFLGRFSGQ